MIYYRCRCGKLESWGSESPSPCDRCAACGSDLASHPDAHREPLEHSFYEEDVETDEGGKKLSRCKFCFKTRKEIEGGKG